MSRSKQVTLFIDDLQWGDGDSAEVLFQLLSTPHSPQVLLLGTFRSDEAKESPFLEEWNKLAADRQYFEQRHVSVEPLSEDQCLTLLAKRIGVEARQLRQQASELFENTRGNPYFLEQLTEGFDAKTGQFAPVPLREIIDRRLKRLPDDSLTLLEVISIAGQAVSLEEASRVARLEQPAFATITHMRSERLVRLVGSQDAQLVDTYHDKIRENVLDQMNEEQRRGWHRRYAESIEARVPHLATISLEESGALDDRVFDLAHHFFEATDSRAFRYQLLAGRAALDAYAMENALAHLRKAQLFQPEQTDRATKSRLSFMLSKALAGCGLLGEAIQGFHDSLDLTDSRSEKAACYYALGEIFWKQSEYSQAFDNLRRGFAELGEPLPKTLLGKLVAGVSAIVAFHLIPAWAMLRLRRRATPDLILLSQMYGKCSTMATQLDMELVVYLVARGCVIAKQVKEVRVKCESYSTYAAVLAFAGAGLIGKRVMASAKRLAEDHADELPGGLYEYNTGMFSYSLGRLDKAEESLQHATERLGRSGDYEERFAQHFLWHLWTIRGRTQEILQYARAEEEIARRSNDQIFLAYSWYGQAEGLARQGQIAEASKAADKALAALEPLNASYVCAAHLQKARVQLQADDYDGARCSCWQTIKNIPKMRFFEITVPAYSVFVEAVLSADWFGDSLSITKRDRRKAAWAAVAARLSALPFPNQRPNAYRASGRLAVANGKTRRGLKYFDKAIVAAKKVGAEYEHARALIDKSRLDYPNAASDREHGLEMLEGLGCVLTDAEVEHLKIDREAHHARAAAAREKESSDDQRESETAAPSHASG